MSDGADTIDPAPTRAPLRRSPASAKHRRATNHPKKHQGWPAHGETGEKGCRQRQTFAGSRRQAAAAAAAVVDGRPPPGCSNGAVLHAQTSRVGAPAAGAESSGPLAPHLERAERAAAVLHDACDSCDKPRIMVDCHCDSESRPLRAARLGYCRSERRLKTASVGSADCYRLLQLSASARTSSMHA